MLQCRLPATLPAFIHSLTHIFHLLNSVFKTEKGQIFKRDTNTKQPLLFIISFLYKSYDSLYFQKLFFLNISIIAAFKKN